MFGVYECNSSGFQLKIKINSLLHIFSLDCLVPTPELHNTAPHHGEYAPGDMIRRNRSTS